MSTKEKIDKFAGDSHSLAEEMSADLAASALPDNLRSIPKRDLEEIHGAIVQDIEDVKQRVQVEEDESENRRLEAIREIKQRKLSKVESELGRRWRVVPPSLTDSSYTELHTYQEKVVADLRNMKAEIRELEDGTDRPRLYRLKAFVRHRKGEHRRLTKEFVRRKEANLGHDRFLVRRASANPEELEEYLNENTEKGAARWPHSLVWMGDHVLVVWRTREPRGAEEI